MLDVTEQLRQYGEAVERYADVARPMEIELRLPRRRRSPIVAVAVCLSVLVGLAVATIRLDDDQQVDVVPATGAAPGPDSAVEGPAAIDRRVDQTVVFGTATWVDPDPRGTLWVGACPVDDDEQGCPSARTTVVAADGTYRLSLPFDGTRRPWRVAAFVAPGQLGCVFSCEWRGVQMGPITTIVVPEPGSVEVSVSARIIDLVVLDRDGNTFVGGGVMVADPSCAAAADPCVGELAAMFASDLDADGRVRVLVDPARAYEFNAMAADTGWPGSTYTAPDGQKFHFATPIVALGRDLPDGTVFHIDGAPARG